MNILNELGSVAFAVTEDSIASPKTENARNLVKYVKEESLLRLKLSASAAFSNRERADNNGAEIKIHKEGDQGVEVQRLQSYGVGTDCHSEFIAICVYVRINMGVYRYSKDFDTDWDYSDPVPDLSLLLH